MAPAAARTPKDLDDLRVSHFTHVRARPPHSQGEFDVHFQPIANIFEPSILGFEALIRAPASTALHSPVVLFEVAASCGRLIELERLIATLIVRRFAQLGLPGRLFLNATADALAAAGNRLPEIRAVLQSASVAAERIVVELTETRPVSDLSTLTDAITRLRELGLSIALDDLGEGFSSLRRWIDLAGALIRCSPRQGCSLRKRSLPWRTREASLGNPCPRAALCWSVGSSRRTAGANPAPGGVA